MARKYDRYGRNRQFRRNPTRSPKFFPYRLPFQQDFRLLTPGITEVSAATASRWRQVVRDITRGELFDSESYADAKRKRDVIDEFNNSEHQIRNAMGEIMFGGAAVFRAVKRHAAAAVARDIELAMAHPGAW